MSDLPQVTGRARLDEGDVGGEAHPVDVRARGAVVEGVEHHVELLKVGDTVL